MPAVVAGVETAGVRKHVVMDLRVVAGAAPEIVAAVDDEVVAELAAEALNRPGSAANHVVLGQFVIRAAFEPEVEALAEPAVVVVVQVVALDPSFEELTRSRTARTPMRTLP